VELGTPMLVADQMFHAAAVLGNTGLGDRGPGNRMLGDTGRGDRGPGDTALRDGGTTDWRALDMAAMHGRITVDGQLRGEDVGADLLGHPLNSLAWLAGSAVAAAFDGLQPGQVIMLGSVTPPIWLTGPASVTVEFPPLPPVQVRLT
jgi:2-keto-4-pentenoate hydratase